MHNPSPFRCSGLALVLVLAALLTLAPIILRRLAVSPPEVSAKTSNPASQPAKPRTQTNDAERPPSPLNSPASLAEILQRIAQSALQLKECRTPDQARQVLARLRGTLDAVPSAVTSGAIREFLDLKADAPSRLVFSIGPNGHLSQASSLRVFLLDYLVQTDPPNAAQYAEKVFAAMDSPDEWAVSFRNYALGMPGERARSHLSERFSAMVRHEPWQREPSIGFLQAFDTAVFLRAPELVPLLAEMLRQKECPSVAQAAFLALDRMVIQNPIMPLNLLLQDVDSMQGREATRASYFARANAGDPAQRELLENYLLSPRISGEEIGVFAALYPHTSSMISFNLLTATATPDNNELNRLEAEGLKAAGEWLADPRFAGVRPHLERLQKRLQRREKVAANP